MAKKEYLFDIDKIISENIEQCAKEEVARFDCFNNVEENISDEFNEKMIRMINEQDVSNKRVSIAQKKGSLRLLSFVAILSVFFITTASACAFSNPIHEFIVNTFGQYFTVDTNYEHPFDNVDFEYKEPTWLPEGEYEREIAKKNDTKYIIYYKYDSFSIVYSQKIIINNENEINNEYENIEIKEFVYNDQNYVFVNEVSSGLNMLYFYNDIYLYKITAPMDCEALTKIIESIS